MVNPIGVGDNLARLANQAPDAARVAEVVDAARTGRGLDLATLAQDVATLRQTDPALAEAVVKQAEAVMTPVERGQFAARLGANDNPAPAARPGANPTELALDVTQIALDVVGIVEPTPFADGANTLISLGRGDLLGAGLSAVGMVPYLGDAAKLGKLGRWAETVANAVELAARNPAAFKAMEPALQKLSDAIGALPIDKLPASARETLEGMKKQIDDAVAMAAKPALRNADGTVNLPAAAQRYSEVVASNKPWSWADDFGGKFTAAERKSIREAAQSADLVPTVAFKPGTRYPDFNAAGLVRKVDTLPADLYKATDAAQFKWLDSRIPGGRPEGHTWHHSETPGRMELVPFGPHNTINHIGGRSPGHWAHAPR